MSKWHFMTPKLPINPKSATDSQVYWLRVESKRKRLSLGKQRPGAQTGGSSHCCSLRRPLWAKVIIEGNNAGKSWRRRRWRRCEVQKKHKIKWWWKRMRIEKRSGKKWTWHEKQGEKLASDLIHLIRHAVAVTICDFLLFILVGRHPTDNYQSQQFDTFTPKNVKPPHPKKKNTDRLLINPITW